jgi:hypothetical protein
MQGRHRRERSQHFGTPLQEARSKKELQNLFMTEAPLFLIAGAFLGVSMVRERAERDLRQKAEPTN